MGIRAPRLCVFPTSFKRDRVGGWGVGGGVMELMQIAGRSKATPDEQPCVCVFVCRCVDVCV